MLFSKSLQTSFLSRRLGEPAIEQSNQTASRDPYNRRPLYQSKECFKSAKTLADSPICRHFCCIHEPLYSRLQPQQRITCPSASGARPSRENAIPLLFITPKMPQEKLDLKLAKLLDRLASSGQHAQDVESDLLLVSPSMFVADPQSPHGRRTVLLRGRHWPTVTWSPSSTRKAGETWAARFLWRFS